MRPLLPLILLPSAAFAHEGPHLHPHGIDSAWLLLSLAVTGAALALAARGRRK